MPVHLEMPSNQPTPSLYSIDGDETQHARMLIDSAPDAEDTNSPTPTADIPLAVPILATVSLPDPVMAILTAIQAQMAQTDARLKAIETGNTQTTANNRHNKNVWGEEYGFDPSIGVGEVSWDTGYEEYCTPEQASALATIQFEKDWIENAATYEAHKLENKYEEEREYTEEEHKVHWAEEEKDYLMHTIGDSAADPIVVRSQSITTMAQSTHPPISHLILDQGRAPIPGLIRVANPRQVNTLPTIGGNSYAS